MINKSSGPPMTASARHRRGPSRKAYACTAVLAVLVLLGVVLPPQSIFPGLTFGQATQAPTYTSEFEPNVDAQVMSSLAISYSQYVNGAKARISSGFASGYDTLKLKYYGGARLTTSWDKSKATLTITGRASGTEYQKILNSVCK